MNKGAKIVNAAIAGLDFITVVVSGKAYSIFPPTINQLAGAGYYLSDVKDGDSMKNILLSIEDSRQWAHALSWFIKGDDSLYDEFSNADSNDVMEALINALSLVSAENFTKLLTLTRSVVRLTAKPK